MGAVPKRVIFLDIDGVLTSKRVHHAYGDHGSWHRFDPVAVAMLNRLCRLTGAVIVLISSWRKDHDRDAFVTVFGAAGFQGCFHPDWATPDHGGPRGGEVKAWLDGHPEVEESVILDDGNDFLPGQVRVRCDHENGMTYRNFVDAVDALTGQPELALLEEE